MMALLILKVTDEQDAFSKVSIDAIRQVQRKLVGIWDNLAGIQNRKGSLFDLNCITTSLLNRTGLQGVVKKHLLNVSKILSII